MFQMVVEMLDEINHTLPRIATFIELLGASPTLLEPSQDCQFYYPLAGTDYTDGADIELKCIFSLQSSRAL